MSGKLSYVNVGSCDTNQDWKKISDSYWHRNDDQV